MEQNTEEWKEFRRSRIGSSDCPIICGVAPWGNAVQLWAEKVGLGEERQCNAAMQRGITYEPEAREFFANLHGVMLSPKVLVHPEIAWMIASVDGMNPEQTVGYEFKVPGKATWAMAINGEIPRYYVYQIQHQMAVSGLKSWWYCVYNPEEKLGVCIQAARDEAIISEIIEKERYFYECMQTLVPPELAEQKADYMEISTSEAVELAEAWKKSRGVLVAAKEAVKAAELKEKEDRQALIDCTDNANTLIGGVKLTRRSRQGRIDWDKVSEAYNIEKSSLERFRGPGCDYWELEAE